MANKSSKSPMAVNKSNTPPWMKAVMIMLVIAFGGLGIVVVAGGAGMLGSPTTTGAGAFIHPLWRRIRRAQSSVRGL